MPESSPVGSSPSKTPFSAPSKRYVSNVYSRRSTGGPSLPPPKRAKRTPSPASGTESDSDTGSGIAISVSNGDKVILGEGLSGSEELARTRAGRGGTQAGRMAKTEVLAKSAVVPRVTGGASKTVEASTKLATRSTARMSKAISPVVTQPLPQRSKGVKRKVAVTRTDTETDIPSATDMPLPEADIPPITVQPATSPPSNLRSSQAKSITPVAMPSTPPRKRPKRNGPLTPQSSPRDLSALFAPVSPARSPALSRRNTAEDLSSEGGLTKKGGAGLLRRMLDKTQSLGAIASPAKSAEGDLGGFGEGDFTTHSPSGPSNIGRTHSLPSTPSKTPAKDEAAAQSLIVPVASSSRPDATALGSGGRGKRTYGRSRTILAEVNDSPRSHVSSNGGDKDVIKESYAELRKQFEVDNSGDDTGSGNLMLDLLAVRGGQSVSDLKSKGENRRFMDELGYLVDPILDSGTSTGLKRSSIHDILRSMQDEDWLQRAKICGQVERIWEAIYEARGEAGDEIIEAMCLLYLVNLVKSGSGLELILRSHDDTCERILLASLKVRNGPLDEVCKVKATGIVSKLRVMYKALDLGWTAKTMSTRRLASYLLGEITSPSIRPSASSSSLLVTEKAISKIVKSLALDVTELAGRFDLVQKGIPLLPTDRKTEIDIDHISQCLIVVSRLIGQGVADRQILADMHESMALVIVNSLVAGIFLSLNGTEEVSGLGSSITLQSLQILATMSNSSSDWSSAIPSLDGALSALARVLLHRSVLVSPTSTRSASTAGDAIEADQDEEARFFSPKKQPPPSPRHDQIGEEDVLCLVLVILTASILGSEDMTKKLAILRMDSGCKGSKSCLLGCRCPSAELFMVHLVRTYVRHRTSEATASSLIAAYVALVLSKLILFQHDFLDLLPGDNRQTILSGLMDELGDLKGLQSLLHTRLKVAAGGEDDDGADGAAEEGMGGDAGVVDAAIEDLKRLARGMEA